MRLWHAVLYMLNLQSRSGGICLARIQQKILSHNKRSKLYIIHQFVEITYHDFKKETNFLGSSCHYL